MMTKEDYYDILGVSRDADGGSIKAAFRKLAMKYHPDRNPDDKEAEAKFKEINEAYSVLSDQEKRAQYDRYGHDAFSGGGFQGAGSFEDIFGGFGDIFSDLFGQGGRRRSGPPSGPDLQTHVTIDFDEAVKGTKVSVTFPRHDLCKSCEGSGAKAGTQPVTCGTCGGRGKVSRQQGFFMVQTTCPVCRGTGQTVKDKCKDCKGQGLEKVERTLSVKIPAGIDHGMRLRIRGEGETGGPNGVRGDLHVLVQVRPHPIFTRDGAHIHMSFELTYSQAVLGSEIEVPTLDGHEKVDVPSGTKHGTVLRLRQRGIPFLDGRGRGDQYIELQIAIPKKLNKKQKKLLQEAKELGL